MLSRVYRHVYMYALVFMYFIRKSHSESKAILKEKPEKK